MILVIDNYDSFTYNLVQYLGELGAESTVCRNDQISVEELGQMEFDRVIISPGPGTPEAAGVSKPAIAQLAGKVPILGICLGHQAIAEVFGAKVIGAPYLMHGKTSEIIYDPDELLFKDIDNPFTATRYHSLIVDINSVKETPLNIIAKTSDNIVMALKHAEYDIIGLQFHPESILTTVGKQILSNFLSNT